MDKHLVFKIIQQKGIGRKVAFKICNHLKGYNISSDNELIELILDLSQRKAIQRLPQFTKSDLQSGIDVANKIIENSKIADINSVSYYCSDYPQLLRRSEDPPIYINYKGDISKLNKNPAVAIIGTRQPNLAGLKAAEYYSAEMAKLGYIVVSGLAIGCDTASHKGCLKEKGTTVAVLGHGLQQICPKENFSLGQTIIERGGVLLSEYSYGVLPSVYNFVERDRIQSGLSLGTIVIQTDINGGTMHAVNVTIKEKKALAAVKYQDTEYGKICGNQYLIQNGKAMPLRNNIQEFKQQLEFVEGSLDKKNDLILAL